MTNKQITIYKPICTIHNHYTPQMFYHVIWLYGFQKQLSKQKIINAVAPRQYIPHNKPSFGEKYIMAFQYNTWIGCRIVCVRIFNIVNFTVEIKRAYLTFSYYFMGKNHWKTRFNIVIVIYCD